MSFPSVSAETPPEGDVMTKSHEGERDGVGTKAGDESPTNEEPESREGQDKEKPDARTTDSPTEGNPTETQKQGKQSEDPAPKTKNAEDKDAASKAEDGKPPGASEADRKLFPSADLWCRVNGFSHSLLLSFKIFECNLCGQKLARPPRPQPTARGRRRIRGKASSSRSVSESSGSTSTSRSSSGTSAERKKKGEAIDYSVTFLNYKRKIIESIPWKGPFDLPEARKGVSAKSAVFSVKVYVRTSAVRRSSDIAYYGNKPFYQTELQNPMTDMTMFSTTITIRSKALIRALNEVVTYYPQVSLDGYTIELEEPFALIAHHIDELQEYRVSHCPSVVETDNHSEGGEREDPHKDEPEVADPKQKGAKDLGRLLDYLEEELFQGRIKDERARHANMRCTFQMLWLLFKPGTTIYVQAGQKVSAYVVQSIRADKSILSATEETHQSRPLGLELWNLDFDGFTVGRHSRHITIPHFDGERLITSLTGFPCQFLDSADGGATKERLEQEGKRWYELLRGGMVHYQGEFVGEKRRHFDGRVVVDSASYYQRHPRAAPRVGNINDMWPGAEGDRYNRHYQRGPGYYPPPPPSPYSDSRSSSPAPIRRRGVGLDAAETCCCSMCQGRRPHPPSRFRWAEYDGLNPKTLESLELTGAPDPMHRYLLCSNELKGLALKSREWEHLNVAYCFPAKRNPKVIDNLVMPEDRKVMIKALVDKFAASPDHKGPFKQWRADWIESKGEGQIFLLHGSPGVGKTLTAECIAEFTDRPLISLTCGDIGTNEVDAESKLSGWFDLAEKWGAVMLLDEADVFLEKRQLTDLNRNSLVSVFLRAVEYYRGILFLTTNRVGHFDDAFMSRIHVIIAYENLGVKQREKIWKQFFQKLADERQDIYIDPRAKRFVLEDPDMRNIEWNGREIRNAFQTAVALAEYRFGTRTDKEDGDMVTLSQSDFEKVCEMTASFKRYLTDVHGGDESTRAYLSKARLDHEMN